MSDDSNSATPPPALSWFSQSLRHLNERKMVQWTIAYVALAYSIQHGVVLTGEAFEWPQLVSRITMLLFILGLPLAVTIAWYHGDRGRQNVSGTELTIISLLMVIGSALFLIFVRPTQEIAGRSPAVQQASVAAPRAAPASAANAISIAVLPFLNLSSDNEQEFFSDGITEEITSALAKVPGLTVIGRTSAFGFKGQNKDLRMIGQALGTTHLIEGSVRKAGTRVRITAQLIIADSGAHLWTENYDRELTDIFAVQEDIAEAIARALRVPLRLQQGDTLVRDRTNNPESYDQYLRARALWRARSPTYGQEVIKILEPVVARDPGYAPAWALLARAYGGRDPKAEKTAREALRLDPQNAMANGMLANKQAGLGNFAAAEDIQKQMLALYPDDTDVLDAFSNGLAVHGRLKEAVRMREKLRTLEPFVPVYNYITASIMLNSGQSQTAIAILKALPAGPAGGGEGARGVTLARAYAEQGRYGEAADTLLAIPQSQGPQSRGSIEEAARLLRSAPTKVSMPGALPAWDGELGFVYAYVGAPDRVLDHPERVGIRSLNPPAARYLWSSEVAPARRTERFKALVRAAGYVDYWRARGWPDSCHPVGADDFACE